MQLSKNFAALLLPIKLSFVLELANNQRVSRKDSYSNSIKSSEKQANWNWIFLNQRRKILSTLSIDVKYISSFDDHENFLLARDPLSRCGFHVRPVKTTPNVSFLFASRSLFLLCAA